MAAGVVRRLWQTRASAENAAQVSGVWAVRHDARHPRDGAAEVDSHVDRRGGRRVGQRRVPGQRGRVMDEHRSPGRWSQVIGPAWSTYTPR